MSSLPQVTRYTFFAGLPQTCRVALVTDLHDQDGQGVLEVLRREQPDLICIAGDLLERNYHWVSTPEDQAEYEFYYLHNLTPRQRRFNRMLHWWYDHVLPQRAPEERNGGMEFLQAAVRLAPVCYATGNHEWFLQEADRSEIRATGAFLLENSACQPFPHLWVGGLPTRQDPDWLGAFCAKKGFRLLLCHHPEYYDWIIKGHPQRTPDLILSGHAHGGQWRFFGRGIYAPGQGFLPAYTHGLYDGRLLVSAGCVQTSPIPRFGNPPEVVLMELLAAPHR